MHPVCREIVREHFRIATEPYDDDDYRASTYVEGPESSDDFVYADSKTIAEAEINCIEAIREAQKEVKSTPWEDIDSYGPSG